MSEITLIVKIKAKSGQEKAVERALRAAVAPTHTEKGCIRFALHRAPSDAATFLLVERWTSQATLDEHLKKPYLVTLLNSLKELAESSEASSYEMLAEGEPGKLL